MDKKLPDTPWHLGYTKKKENDPRRHKSRCIYLLDGKCHCGESGAYTLKCPGSSHCINYAETEEQDKLNKEQYKSVEAECRERADDYKTRIRKRCKEIMQIDKMRYWNERVDIMVDCPFCGERFLKKKEKIIQYKECQYCGAVYHIVGNANVDTNSSEFLVKRR